MAGTLQPLDQKFAIVDAQGRPTDYFTRWAQQKQIDIGDSITLPDLQTYLTEHALIEGSGIQFSPSGDLNEHVTIAADVQEILDQISATRGAILYRGLLGWAALLPGTVGQFLKTNGAGADPAWASGGGGSTPWYWNPPALADFPTTVIEGGAISPSPADDADLGMRVVSGVNANDNLYALVQTPPAVPFTITAHIATSVFLQGILGIVLRASTTGLRTLFGLDAALGYGGLVIRRATGVTFNATLQNQAVRNFAAQPGIWLRVVVTSLTNVSYQISGDGKTWIEWQANTLNGQVANLNQIGLGISSRGGALNQPVAIDCDYWDVS